MHEHYKSSMTDPTTVGRRKVGRWASVDLASQTPSPLQDESLMFPDVDSPPGIETVHPREVIADIRDYQRSNVGKDTLRRPIDIEIKMSAMAEMYP